MLLALFPNSHKRTHSCQQNCFGTLCSKQHVLWTSLPAPPLWCICWKKKLNKWGLYILKASSWILDPLLIFHPGSYFPFLACLCSLSEDIKVLRKQAKIFTGVVFETRTLEIDAPRRNLTTTSQITCVNVIIPTHLQASCAPRDPFWAPEQSVGGKRDYASF